MQAGGRESDGLVSCSDSAVIPANFGWHALTHEVERCREISGEGRVSW